MRIDLHTHSNASDGTLTPALLIKEAAAKDIRVLALTDHDTVDGIAQAQEAAAVQDVRLIPGVELEIEWERGEFHLLGLGLDTASRSLKELLSALSKIRRERNFAMLDKMNRLFGLSAGYDDICALAGERASVGRPHFASYLIRHHKVKNMEMAFTNYLGFGLPLYVRKPGVEFDKAVDVIHEAGGFAVIAHPATLCLSAAKTAGVLEQLAARGLDGVEAWHPNATVSGCQRYAEMAALLGLFITAGSDYHGERRKDRKLGITCGGRKIDDSFLPEPLRR
jgi:predicted metal-dependent phosphoesterase TrpH